MDISQLALAVINDRATELDRIRAVQLFLMHSRESAVLSLMQAVYAELDKPIYDGVELTDQGQPAECWAAGNWVLDYELEQTFGKVTA